MKWRVVVRPEIEKDLTAAADWYDTHEAGLGDRFIEEILDVFDFLANNPFLNSRRHPEMDVRWRYPEHFPYRVIYEVQESEKAVVVAAVIHAARHDRRWKKRI
ncbi:MAG TPA: type II toxin-antitoxin system RelE/ParE family toxin [Verrucomicrobiae bacterium]|jgi:toxin ParE1/3/4|nr:type II toxin-antitoxin system RelE/ParE family toxin [Verrucomicrobiae bacterium]